jgi:hypothetical protein
MRWSSAVYSNYIFKNNKLNLWYHYTPTNLRENLQERACAPRCIGHVTDDAPLSARIAPRTAWLGLLIVLTAQIGQRAFFNQGRSGFLVTQ